MSTAEQTEGDDLPWGEVTPDAARRLLVAAVEAFAERGYHATTTRDIAGRAGDEPRGALHPLQDQGRAAPPHQPDRPRQGAAAPARRGRPSGHRGGAARRRRTVLRALARRPSHHRPRRPVRAGRARRGAPHGDRRAAPPVGRGGPGHDQRRGADGEFDVPDVPGTTLAVLSLCIDVARWFNVAGHRTPDEVGALYADLVLRMVGARAQAS